VFIIPVYLLFGFISSLFLSAFLDIISSLLLKKFFFLIEYFVGLYSIAMTLKRPEAVICSGDVSD
jgi:hypothetical protein